jgi:hypothetical protein
MGGQITVCSKKKMGSKVTFDVPFQERQQANIA